MKTCHEFLGDVFKYDLIMPKLDILDDRDICTLHSYANGCGRKGGIKFPSSFLGVDIESACILHDIEWHLAESPEDLQEANENFDDNLKKICDTESNILTRVIRRILIARYVDAVELYGTPNEVSRRFYGYYG